MQFLLCFFAIGNVVMNRKESGKWGDDICDVVGAKRQFAPGVLDQLALIALGQAAGLSLDEIRSMLSPNGGPSIDRKVLAAKAEEIDAMLLSSELPIDAYLDRGFQAWLKTAGQY